MPTPNFKPLGGNPSTQEIQDYIVKLIRDLNFMLSNLDTLNVNRLDAKVIIAGSITADQIAAGAITADKIDVNELSAITANMGTLTAGSITTNAQINIGTDATVGNNLYVGSNDSTSDSKIYLNGAYIQSEFGAESITMSGAGYVLLTSLAAVILTSSLNVSVNSQNGTITDIVGSINALTTAISGKANSGGSTSSVSVADDHNHGFSNTDYIQCYDEFGVATSKKQWVGYTGSVGHSHTI